MRQTTALMCALALVASLFVSGTALAQQPDGAPKQAVQKDPSKKDTAPRPIEGELTLTQSFGAVIEGVLVEGGANDTEPIEGTVGTPLILTLNVGRPVDTSVILPEGQKTGRFELVRVEREPVAAEPGAKQVTETVRMVYAVYRPGRHTMASFELKVADASGGVSTIKTEPVTARIKSVVANEVDPAMPAMRPPVSVWAEDWTLSWILGIFLGLLLAFGIGALAYRALAPPPPPPPPPPPRPAHEIALEKLASIAAADLPDMGLYEEFYVRVSEAVREYLGRRYNLSLTDVAGLELTTEELVDLLREIQWPRGVDLRFVEALLYDCDIVKFARYTPSGDEATEILQRAYQLVELTRVTVLGAAALASSEAGEALEAASEAVPEAAVEAPEPEEPESEWAPKPSPVEAPEEDSAPDSADEPDPEPAQEGEPKDDV